MEVAQRRVRLDADRLHERGARRAVGRERLGLAARPVEREHELAAQALAQGMALDELLQLRHQLAVAAGGEVGLDARLERREPLLLQPRDRALRERRERLVAEGRAAPQRERIAQQAPGAVGVAVRERAPPLVGERAEAVAVELAGPDAQPVAGRRGLEHVGAAERRRET